MSDYAVQMEIEGSEPKKRKKVLLIFLCLILSLGMLIGLMLAFFSDVVSGDTTVTAGTLDLAKGTVVIKQNGADIKTVGNLNEIVENFNPGDVVTVTVPVANEGSKSAWIRGKFSISGTAATEAGGNDLPVYIFEGALTQAQAETAVAGGATSALTVTHSGGTYSFADSTPDVIDGKAGLKDVEVEKTVSAGGTVPDGTTIHSSASCNVAYTLYFKPGSGNRWQDKALKLSYAVEAIQYRNNTSPVWSTVVELT
jgi:hypothetical protein